MSIRLPREMIGPLKGAVAGAKSWRIFSDFLSPEYQRHNVARLDHLDSLGLVGRGRRVLEVGAGVGDHSLFYLFRGCTVVATDGRPELVAFMKQRLGIHAKVVDADTQPEALRELGSFDILHCYGLLYHLSRPKEFLEHAARTADVLFLETVVSWGEHSALNPVGEDPGIYSQALHGGCRPTRPWVFETLKASYAHVYLPKTQPRHEQFPVDWQTPPPANELRRAVFVASHKPLKSELLLSSVPSRYHEE